MSTKEEGSQVVESVRFSFMTDEDVRKLSVLKINAYGLFDKKGNAIRGGLNDWVMGNLDKTGPCWHCGLNGSHCPGHYGHIEFVYPIYHPFMFNLLYSFVERTCFSCRHFMAKKEKVERCVSQLKLIIKGDIVAAKQLDSFAIDPSIECEDSDMGKQRWTSLQFALVTDVMNQFLRSKSKKCKNCNAASPKLEKLMFGWIRMADSSNQEREINFKICEELLEQKDSRDLSPLKVKELLKDLWKNEYEFCSFIGDLCQSGSEKNDYSMFFLESVLVPPMKFRPPALVGDSVDEALSHPQTLGLHKVLQSSMHLGNAHTKRLDPSKIIYRWMNLQKSVNVLFDSKTATVQSQKEGFGICQLLEKKEGLFRQNLMGKRVNHACRSMISPDPYIAVNEIGVPLSIAMKLTYPEA